MTMKTTIKKCGISVCLMLSCACQSSAPPPAPSGAPSAAPAGTPSAASSGDTTREAAHTAKPTPLILEKNEGERRFWRVESFPAPFILKVDPQNGGSSHLVLGIEDLEPGGKIETHRHPGSDEILFLQTGTAKVTVGELSRDVHAGATVFIPADTWISLANTGPDPIQLVMQRLRASVPDNGLELVRWLDQKG
jgi:quercetin dioxygenase-like cupin family protein